jgi:hypothetical protein
MKLHLRSYQLYKHKKNNTTEQFLFYGGSSFNLKYLLGAFVSPFVEVQGFSEVFVRIATDKLP